MFLHLRFCKPFTNWHDGLRHSPDLNKISQSWYFLSQKLIERLCHLVLLIWWIEQMRQVRRKRARKMATQIQMRLKLERPMSSPIVSPGWSLHSSRGQRHLKKAWSGWVALGKPTSAGSDHRVFPPCTSTPLCFRKSNKNTSTVEVFLTHLLKLLVTVVCISWWWGVSS